MLAQNKEISFGLSGAIVGGYVDNSAFLNFTGPGIKIQKKDSELLIGVLPTLRFKSDKEAIKNTFVTPTLGFGITYSFRLLVVQIPLYYNSKTKTKNGCCNFGIGIGINLNKL